MRTEKDICARLGIAGMRPHAGEKLGIALATIGKVPINGLRIHLEGTCGWFIWAGGEPSADPDFYQPLCAGHIGDYLPLVEPYLSLPVGYRFQIDEAGYEDIWFDSVLVEHK
jgi:hypothetical protein